MTLYLVSVACSGNMLFYGVLRSSTRYFRYTNITHLCIDLSCITYNAVRHEQLYLHNYCGCPKGTSSP